MTSLNEATKAAPKRNAIVLDGAIQERVAKIAREAKLTQGVVILAMMDLLEGTPEFDAKLKELRDTKVGGRTGKTALLKKLAKLSAEDLERLAASLESEE